MKINFDELPEFHQWILSSLPLDKIEEFTSKDRELNIEVKINGVDVDFVQLFKYIQDEFNLFIDQKAKEFIIEGYEEVLSKATELYDKIDNFVKELKL